MLKFPRGHAISGLVQQLALDGGLLEASDDVTPSTVKLGLVADTV